MSRTQMYTIVVASGTSQRFGSDKLAEKLGLETVLERTVRIALENSDGVVVVTDPEKYSNENVYAVVAGGETRTQSVKNGLEVIPLDVDVIAVQDGARPGADALMYATGRELVERGASGAIPVIEVVDTIKKTGDQGEIEATIPRDTLRAAQTPQIFNAGVLREAYLNARQESDDAALVENLGHVVLTFSGSEKNRKITTVKDLNFLRAEFSLNSSELFRVGNGYDIHPFGADSEKKLILGGVEIDHPGLVGHSDSDALSHGLTDAILSAIGAPDLGSLFPASDSSNKDISSLVFLEKAVLMAANEGYFLGNASIVINAEKPKLSAYLQDMTKKLKEVLDPILNSSSQITITPKHGEGIGEIGQGKAIAVHATVLLHKPSN